MGVGGVWRGGQATVLPGLRISTRLALDSKGQQRQGEKKHPRCRVSSTPPAPPQPPLCQHHTSAREPSCWPWWARKPFQTPGAWSSINPPSWALASCSSPSCPVLCSRSGVLPAGIFLSNLRLMVGMSQIYNLREPGVTPQPQLREHG